MAKAPIYEKLKEWNIRIDIFKKIKGGFASQVTYKYKIVKAYSRDEAWDKARIWGAQYNKKAKRSQAVAGAVSLKPIS